MPVKIVIDTSNATDQETGDFLKEHNNIFRPESTEIQFKSQIPANTPSQADIYKEMMQSVRQYGAIRYILFPLYLTLTAVLAGANYKNDYNVPLHLIRFAGISSSVAWLVFEYALSESLRRIWGEIENIIFNSNVFPAGAGREINPLPHRVKLLTWLPRITFYLIYIVGIAFWGCMFSQSCCRLLS